MTLAQFLRLVGAGEKFNVDFKLQCNAFNPAAGDHKKAKAELVKDICAMANNSGSTSYLIIGLGDDRKTVRSVVEHALTSQNIQPFLRENIMPLPKVTVKRAKWNDAPAPFAGVEFVIIQVGPHPRAAYRFARDHIDGCGKFHFRKNEVWVRNEDTSDLATPERIGQLLGMRRFAEAEPELSFTNVEYQILPKAAQIAALAADVCRHSSENGDGRSMRLQNRRMTSRSMRNMSSSCGA